MPAEESGSTEGQQSDDQPIYRLRIDLKGIKPPIWRRIEVPDCTLDDLHECIQNAMGWFDCHLWEFYHKHERYGCDFLCEEDPDVEHAGMVRLSEVAQVGSRFHYIYDFGDGWEHTIKVEAIHQAKRATEYPRCTAGRRNCPPEDCGGIYGYYDLLEVFANPEAPENAERLEWCEGFDPEEFDVAEADAAVKLIDLSVSADEDFDIHADVMTSDGELDTKATQKQITHLSQLFEESPEFKSLNEDEYQGGPGLLMNVAFFELGKSVIQLSVTDLDTLLTSVIARRILAPAEAAKGIVDEIRAFLRFIEREFDIEHAGTLAKTLTAEVSKRLARVLKAEGSGNPVFPGKPTGGIVPADLLQAICQRLGLHPDDPKTQDMLASLAHEMGFEPPPKR